MTFTIRTLVLLSVSSLACACDTPASSPTSSKAKASSKQVAGKLVVPAVDQAALTAAAPAKVHSVIDSVGKAPLTSIAEGQLAPAASPTTQASAPSKDQPATEAVASPADVRIDRFVLATGVEAREPSGEADTFSTETEKIFAFVQFENENTPAYAVRVHWEPAAGPASAYGFALEVPSAKRWRTWSSTSIRRSPGRYRAVLRTLEGEEIASREFVIEAEPRLTP